MDSIAKIRFLIAAGIAPLLMPLLVYSTFVLSFGSVIEKNEGMQTSISSATWLAYLTALVFGAASYYWLRRKRWWSVWRFMMMGTASGCAGWLVFSVISQTLFFNRIFYAFVISGLLMGACFWLVAYFQPDGNHLIPNQRSGRRRRRRT